MQTHPEMANSLHAAPERLYLQDSHTAKREQVPMVSLLDMWVLPTTEIELVRLSPASATIRALDTTIEGSSHVEALDLNNRFELDLDVHLEQDADRCVVDRSRMQCQICDQC